MTHRRRELALSLVAAAAAALAGVAGSARADSAPSATDALLAPEAFSSKTEGFQFRPPAGGTEVRQLNSGEIVRFAYPERGWTIVLRSAPNSTHLAMLTPPDADATRTGLLDVTAGQLTDRGGEPATLLRKDVVPVGPAQVGLIEARDNSGINRLFLQVAILPDKASRYFLLQMISPSDASKKDAPLGPQESDARQMFQRMLATATVVDRRPFVEEQKRRLYNTRELWVQVDRKRVEAALQPAVRYMRVVRSGKDVGYVQVNQRVEQHHGRDGVLVVARSHLEGAAEPAAAAAPAVAAAAGPTVDLPGRAPPAPVATGPTRLEREAKFFVTFDRGHEDWTVVTRLNNRVGDDAVEMGNSDVEVRRMLDTTVLHDQARLAGHDRQPPVLDRETDMLRVDDYRGKLPTGKQVEQQLDYRYLPQALAQLMPQLLPVDQPKQYMFAFYVSEQRALLARYVDVGAERQVDLDGRSVRAVPITDRVGADGAASVHYVGRDDGQWLGTVSDEGRLVVLPTDEPALAAIWKGFQQLPDPPPPAADDERTTPRRYSPARRPDGPPADLPTGSFPPTLDSRPAPSR